MTQRARPTKPIADAILMQHADGELSADDTTALAAELHDDDRVKLESLGQLRELVAGHHELTADDVHPAKFAAMWRDIDKAIDDARPRSLWARIAAWLDRYRGHVLTGAASAGAVAAVALIVRSTGGDAGDPATASTRSIEVLPAAMRTAPVVESLDTPEGSGMVMNFEDEDGHTTVIWVTPADTVEGI